MSKGKEIAVQVAGVSSSQEWTTDPDMVEVIVTDDLLLRAEKCIPFMLENDISYVCRWWSFGYTLYELAENMDDDDLKGKTIIQGIDGQSYVEFEPEYRLDGCHAKIFKDGCIRAVLPFKNTSDELWFDIGHISDLKQRMGLGNESGTPSGGAALHATQVALSQAMQHVEKAGKFVDQIAGLSIWDHDQNDGAPYEECEEPEEGYLDSHRCLMNLVEQARLIQGGQ